MFTYFIKLHCHCFRWWNRPPVGYTCQLVCTLWSTREFVDCEVILHVDISKISCHISFLFNQQHIESTFLLIDPDLYVLIDLWFVGNIRVLLTSSLEHSWHTSESMFTLPRIIICAAERIWCMTSRRYCTGSGTVTCQHVLLMIIQ